MLFDKQHASTFQWWCSTIPGPATRENPLKNRTRCLLRTNPLMRVCFSRSHLLFSIKVWNAPFSTTSRTSQSSPTTYFALSCSSVGIGLLTAFCCNTARASSVITITSEPLTHRLVSSVYHLLNFSVIVLTIIISTSGRNHERQTSTQTIHLVAHGLIPSIATYRA